MKTESAIVLVPGSNRTIGVAGFASGDLFVVPVSLAIVIPMEAGFIFPRQQRLPGVFR